MKKTLLLLFLPLTCYISAQTILVNEISVCNVSKNLDPNYDYSSWIEIYNPTTKTINLGSYYYSDERGNPLKYRLKKNRYISPEGFGLLWENDEVNDQNGTYLDLDSDGGFFSIADADGNVLDSISYGEQYTNVSYGRKQDGGTEWGFFVHESIASSNNGIATASEVVEEPFFSLRGGFYDSGQTVEIYSLTPDAKIYYTLDCSDPDPSKNLYDGNPIKIDSTTVLRAKAYADGYLEGTIATATYMLNQRKPDLPVVFITSDTINLYNDTVGIYCVGTNGIKLVSSGDIANYNQNWTRYAHFEYLDENKQLCLSQAVGLSISGNQSRAFDQKSLELKARGKYGTKRFDYHFFDDNPGKRFKTLVVRNGGQQFIPAFVIKDAFNQQMAAAFNLDHQGYLPCAVYLNGQYWGLMPLREKSNGSFIYSNYNYDDTDFDMIEPTEAMVGNTLKMDSVFNYVQSADMSDDSTYNYIRSKIDVDNYMRYMASEFFLINTDWPSKANMRFFCPKKEDGRFRWILQDLDKGFTYYSNNPLSILTKSTIDKFYMKLITYLLQNAKFRDFYIDTQCLVAGAVFNTDRINTELDRFVADLHGENDYNAARWDETWIDNLNDGVSDMKKNTAKLKK
ncbi:MAG: CotH kinase family protein [Paludibacter sp.]|nr:CotH kinase family protein [Paludibacter sp.]